MHAAGTYTHALCYLLLACKEISSVLFFSGCVLQVGSEFKIVISTRYNDFELIILFF